MEPGRCEGASMDGGTPPNPGWCPNKNKHKFHIHINNTETNVEGFSKNLNYSMNSFEYDLRSEEKLLLLIDYLKNLDIKVTLILSPYHPDLYQMAPHSKEDPNQYQLHIYKKLSQYLQVLPHHLK